MMIKISNMKKLLFIVFLALSMNANAQITFEHAYDSAATSNYASPTAASQLLIINFTISGERYVKINRWGKTIQIYDMNHSLVKTISLAGIPNTNTYGIQDILYISENLFSTDGKICFLYTDLINFYTGIYNEDGVLLFSEDAAASIKLNIPQQQYPIYNTSHGTKMILSYKGNGISNYKAKVFSLPGTLTTEIQEANGVLLSQSSISNPYPNPVVNYTKIDYTLPPGIDKGEIVFYNLQGIEVKRFNVDRTFNTLLVSTADITTGTYYYQLQTSLQSSEGKKMIVVK